MGPIPHGQQRLKCLLTALRLPGHSPGPHQNKHISGHQGHLAFTLILYGLTPPLSSGNVLATRLIKASLESRGGLGPLRAKIPELYRLNLGTLEACISGGDEVINLILSYNQTGTVDKPSVHCQP